MRILSRSKMAACFATVGLARGLVVAISTTALWSTASVASAPTSSDTASAKLTPVTTQLGSYMAGRVARSLNDVSAAASFYKTALARDPDNEILLEQAFLTQVTEGNWSTAAPLAEKLVKVQPSHRMAQAFMGLSEFKKSNFSEADTRLKAAAVNPIGELTSLLSRAWVKQAAGKTQEAPVVPRKRAQFTSGFIGPIRRRFELHLPTRSMRPVLAISSSRSRYSSNISIAARVKAIPWPAH
jgi:hypothetical protein